MLDVQSCVTSVCRLRSPSRIRRARRGSLAILTVLGARVAQAGVKSREVVAQIEGFDGEPTRACSSGSCSRGGSLGAGRRGSSPYRRRDAVIWWRLRWRCA